MNRQVWLLAAGRLLLQIGTGFTLFYAAIFFVDRVGLSATAVGLALGSQSLSGILGRFWGGVGSDSPQWGRKRVLLWSAAISAIADGVLAIATNLPLLWVGNLLMGLGVGLYWPATEALVADLTTPDQRSEAFALTRLADMVGLSVGTVLAGQWLTWSENYRLLFVLDGCSFVLFFGLIFVAIADQRPSERETEAQRSDWQRIRRDRVLWLYCGVNVLFTSALAQIQVALPLYFTRHLTAGSFSAALLSTLLTGHIILAAVVQLPIARRLNALTRWQALMVSIALWGLSFVGIGATGIVSGGALPLAVASLSLVALATVTYTPSASALVVDLAPPELRGLYLSMNSQCWAVGYFLGPLVGGWAMDRAAAIAHGFWLGGAIAMGIGFVVLWRLDRNQQQHHRHRHQLIEQAIRACEAQDANHFAALFSADGQIQLASGQTITGQDAIAQVTAQYFARCRDIHIELKNTEIGRHRAIIDWIWSEPGKTRHNRLEITFQAHKIAQWVEF